METCENCNYWLKSTEERIHKEEFNMKISAISVNAGVCLRIDLQTDLDKIDSDNKSAIIKKYDREELRIPHSIKFVTGKDFYCNGWSEKLH